MAGNCPPGLLAGPGHAEQTCQYRLYGVFYGKIKG